MPRGRRLRQMLENQRIVRERIENQNQRRQKVQFERRKAREHLEEMERMHQERLRNQDIRKLILQSWLAPRGSAIRWAMVIIFVFTIYTLLYVWWFQMTNLQYFDPAITTFFSVMLIFYIFEVYDFIFTENPFEARKLLFMLSMGMMRANHDSNIEAARESPISDENFVWFRFNQLLINILLILIPGILLLLQWCYVPGFLQRSSLNSKVIALLLPPLCYWLCTFI